MWEMFAHKYSRDNDEFFMHVGTLNYVKFHFLKEPIVKVKVEESTDGRYWGWLRTGELSPTMIWPSKVQFSMCFPYGFEVEEKAGKGRAVRLSIIEILDS